MLNLIIESGVNWNRDERLFALFMMDPKVRVLPFARPVSSCSNIYKNTLFFFFLGGGDVYDAFVTEFVLIFFICSFF